MKGKVVGKNRVSVATDEAREGEVPLRLHRARARGRRHVGDPHGQVIGAVGPVAALAALVLVATAPTPTVDRVDEQAAWSRLVRQVRLGPRPAGSPASRKLATQLKAELPRGSFQAVPGGLRNVVGFVPGRDPSRTVVVGAHYDTKDLPGFVGANDGAGGTALVVELARTRRAAGSFARRSSSSSSTARSRRGTRRATSTRPGSAEARWRRPVTGRRRR